MPASAIPSHPIVSADEVRELEKGLFAGDERKEWKAMLQAGRAVASALLADFGEAGALPARARVLVLAGKGNNAGDALIAANAILERIPGASADVLFVFGPRRLRPLAARAWRGLAESARGRVRSVEASSLAVSYDIAIDGIFGFQFRPPLPREALDAIAAAARCSLRFRAAVDLPSGLGQDGAFGADFTYATGSVKDSLLGCANAGRPRYLDLGFFDGAHDDHGVDRVILSSILGPLAGMRRGSSDKRSQGHLAIVGGSGNFPGAILMTTMAALKSGVGLVTAFVPERLVPGYAARAPEAMWVGLPETPSGGLAAGGLAKVLKAAERASAIVFGPGLGREPAAVALAKGIAKAAKVPLVIDADALQPDIVRLGKAPRILTPHAGEFKRIAEGMDLRRLSRTLKAVIIAKGPVTRVCDGGAVYHDFFGGPVLARGGSGDILAGLTGGLLAQTPGDPLLAACRAAVWQGAASDLLARSRGQTSVNIMELLAYLPSALRA
ncbi:MAG TPA: NAD(P)H-hydrate dehydratase [Opitutaceae bacterium]